MATYQSKICVVVPAFNEGSVIKGVLTSLKDAHYSNIIVVDDGSEDETFKAASSAGVRVMRHSINRGLGGALGTGLKAATYTDCEVVVTFDADGQHAVDDIERVALPILNGKADVVIGSRLKNHKGMPWYRVMMNMTGNFVTYLLFGVWCSDTQSGLRAFSHDAATKIRIHTNRMEVSSEIIREIGRRELKMQEVPIKAIYTDYSLSKGQSLFTGIKTFFKLILHRLMH
ncbi:glycosyltransferase family 2 protein [Candidatus Peregrinibacteria bacterium CG10_big_fil_rev_8_21_14_0_10_44_7]|nr:MAG: hypothetical protein AUK45_05385 [Candidatus Peregrinibacteria bacterium CG2_30_44_17]PIS03567.1 MAG: glycosyltransferase family 2 protein [Candidatus Peregrinibacteria bacterium CG10_big_fil_rev_8_21_14_0_10_44_7]PJB88558.1 MAG: glycosyltransferase family 2 protein [Candidatus Peregrinibacteria bacterium CG_4_9_14_0_8_um_filter_44_15]